VVALSLQLNNLAELKNRQSNFTNRFNLPTTANNKIIIENAQKVQTLTSIPYKILDARIYQKGVPLVQKGKAVIQEITESSISVNIFDGNTNFFDIVDEKQLCDLDLSEFDHEWDEPDATASATNDYTGGYTYPILDYGLLPTTGTDFDISYQYPSVFIRTIIDQIAIDSGYTFKGLIFNDEFFNKVAVAFANDEFKNKDRFIEENLFILNQTNSDRLDVFDSIPENTSKTHSEENTLTFSSFTFDSTTTLRVQITGDVLTNIVFNSSGGGANYSIRFLKNSVAYYSKFVNNSGAINIISSEETFVATDVLEVQIYLSYTLISTAFNDSEISAEFKLTNGVIQPFDFDTTILEGGLVNIEAILPDMSQTEFLKSIANMFGVIFNTNPIERTVTWVQYKELYFNRGKSVDWSDKLDIRSFDKVTKLGNYAQKSNLLYKEDEEVTLGLGDGSIIINDETLDAETDLFELEFAASDSQSNYFDYDITAVKIPKLTGSPVELDTSTEPRLVYIEKEGGGSPAQNIFFTGISTGQNVSEYNVAKFIDADYPNNLAFSNNLKVSNYRELEKSTLNQAQSLELKFKIDELDLANIDITVPVYVDYYNAYFYINKIKEFTGREELTTVDLVKL
jgi:hypothetical protein